MSARLAFAFATAIVLILAAGCSRKEAPPEERVVEAPPGLHSTAIDHGAGEADPVPAPPNDATPRRTAAVVFVTRQDLTVRFPADGETRIPVIAAEVGKEIRDRIGPRGRVTIDSATDVSYQTISEVLRSLVDAGDYRVVMRTRKAD